MAIPPPFVLPLCSVLSAVGPPPRSAPCRPPFPAGSPASPLTALAPPHGGWDVLLRPWSLVLRVTSRVLSATPLPSPAARGVVAPAVLIPAVAIVVPPRGPALAPLWGPGVVTTVVCAGKAAVMAAWEMTLPPSCRAGPRSPSSSTAGGAVVLPDVVHLVVTGSHLVVDVVETLPADGADISGAGALQYAGKTESVPAKAQMGFIVNGAQADRACQILGGILGSILWCGLGHLAAAVGAVSCQVLLQRHLALQTKETQSSWPALETQPVGSSKAEVARSASGPFLCCGQRQGPSWGRQVTLGCPCVSLLRGQGGDGPLRHVQAGAGKAGEWFLAAQQLQPEPGAVAGQEQRPGPCWCPRLADPLCAVRREPADGGPSSPHPQTSVPDGRRQHCGPSGLATPQKD